MAIQSFEETYPHHPFAVLVAGAIALARWLKGLRAHDRLGSRPVTPEAAR